MEFMWENIFRRSGSGSNTYQLLATNILFEELSPRELKFIESLVHTRNYRTGEYIFRQGEVGVGMYIVSSGYVDITYEDLPGGGSGAVYVTRLETGDFFGEIALIEDSGRRTANAIASSDVTVLGFFKPDLQELIERNPLTGVKVITRLAQVLGRRLRETSDKITALKKELQRT